MTLSMINKQGSTQFVVAAGIVTGVIPMAIGTICDQDNAKYTMKK